MPAAGPGAATHRVCVAPMMDCTDRHCRFFLRLMGPDIRLYTEMVTARAILHGDPGRLLAFDSAEHPVALQLGGAEPDELGRAAALARPLGYDEVNLNVGCPSDRVRSGRFGACLMAEPERVADCVRAMGETAGCPVTVKTRIGIDDQDDYAFLARFVATVAESGCELFIIHARKAILGGLSPRDNLRVPPLRYELVRRLREDFPALHIVLNGGIDSLEAAVGHLAEFDGVMIGRKAYAEPFFLTALQAHCFGRPEVPPERAAIVARMAEYAAEQIDAGASLHHIARHMLGLYAGRPGARRWRRFLSEHARGGDADVLRASLRQLVEAA